jgi:hypothetical protein
MSLHGQKHNNVIFHGAALIAAGKHTENTIGTPDWELLCYSQAVNLRLTGGVAQVAKPARGRRRPPMNRQVWQPRHGAGASHR